MNPFQVVDDFEKALCEYTGAPFAVTTASCTDALGICFEYLKSTTKVQEIEIPMRTYIGVPMQAKRTGFKIHFVNVPWEGAYPITPFNLIDSARRFKANMWKYGYVCVSFHGSKILGYTHGGAILHNNPSFNRWARAARFDGREENVSWGNMQPVVLGRHANMTPDVAAALLYKLYHLPADNPDLPNSDYPDLSKMDIFK